MLPILKKINLSTQIIFGENAELKLDLPEGRLLFVISSSVNKQVTAEFYEHYTKSNVVFFNEIKPGGEPWSEVIDRVYLDLPDSLQGIVAIGGGSVIDFAKALSILIGGGGAINDYEFGQRQIENVLPLWAIPTTCGSGSEVTPYCVINNTITGRKFTLSSNQLKPVQAAINPEFLRNLPGLVRLETGLDAFTHCLEALLNRSHVLQIVHVATKGLKIAAKALPHASSDISEIELLQQLSLLSLYGGVAITYSRTGMIHTLSVAFAPYIKMSHGLLNIFLLKYAIENSLPDYNGRLRDVISNMFERHVESDSDALNILQNWLESIIGKQSFNIKGLIVDKASIVDRVLQDKGLPDVTYGVADRKSIEIIVGRILNEIR
jgi:alcohol dehydrogenase class IV